MWNFRTFSGPLLILAILQVAVVAEAKAGEIRVGAISDLTGPYNEVGQQMADAKDLAAAHVNAQGGFFASGETLSLIRGDGKCDADAGLSAGQALAAEGVVAIAGATCSGATLAVARKVTIPAGLPQISPSSTAPVISDLEDNDGVFRLSPSDTLLGAELSGMIHDRFISTVSVTFANDDYNRGVAEVFLETYQRNGGTIHSVQEHEPGETNYDAMIDELASDEKTQSLVVFAYYDRSGVDVIEAAQKDGRFEIFFGADGMINDSLIEQVGAENLSWALFMIAATNDRASGFRAYAPLATDAGLDPSVAFTPQSYDSVFLLALAIEQAGSTDPAAIRAALREVSGEPGKMILPGQWAEAKAAIAAGEAINYMGASGVIEFDPAGDTEGIFSVNTVKPDASWDVFVLR